MSRNNLTSNSKSIQVHGNSSSTSIAENIIADSTCGIEIALYDLLPTSSPIPPSSNGGYVSSASSASYSSSKLSVTQSHSVIGNTLTNNQRGILVSSANDTELADNVITGGQYGITLGYSSSGSTQPANNTVKGNTVTKSSNVGIYLWGTFYNSVVENSVNDCQNGILLSSSRNNSITANHVTNSKLLGLQVASSSTWNVLRGNSLDANGYGFGDDSLTYGYDLGVSYNLTTGEVLSKPKYQTNDVDASNTVNGKAIYYWVGQSSKTVPSDAGTVILVNCTNITVQNLNLTGNYDGVQLAFTYDSTIIGNLIQNNSRGIRLFGSSDNNVADNNIVGNNEGIRLDQRSFSTGIGIGSQMSTVVFATTGNLITKNNFTSNTYGVAIGDSYGSGPGTPNEISGNTFYHNYFNNKNQVNMPYRSSTQPQTAKNAWDNGEEGNYWSDYNGTDANHDGIGDTPYAIKARTSSRTGPAIIVVAEDRFPLMQRFPKVP
jgi:parallel beta-helix repeat protein